MKISLSAVVGVSNRHVHLTEKDYLMLFGNNNITVRNYLKQPREFASNDTVTLKSEEGKIIENVRVLGPFRNYSQVEISKSDAYTLKVNPPVRKSGDLKGSEKITIIGPNREIKLSEGLIIANRHVHLDKQTATELGIKDEQPINVNINTEKKGRIVVYAKVMDEAVQELHLDTDDANAFLLSTGDKVEFYL